MGKDKKKHKKKHKKQDVVSTSEQRSGLFTYTLHFGSIPTTYGSGWMWHFPVRVPQIFQDAFEDGELEP